MITRFKNILLFAGTKDSGEFSLKRAAQLAEENSATLTVLDVVKPAPTAIQFLSGSSDSDELQRYVCQERREDLERICKEVLPESVDWKVDVQVGQPAVNIIQCVLRDGYDLVLKTADGRGFLKQHLFGSVAKSLFRKCPCPVWIVRPDKTPNFDRIVAAVDATSEDAAKNGINDHVIELASSLAELEKAELHVVQVWQLWMEQALRRRGGDDDVEAMSKQHRDAAESALNKLLSRHKISATNAEIHLIEGVAGFVIPKFVKEIQADILVMGTVCRIGIPGFLIGNTAEWILNDVDASVLAVKPDGFKSPMNLD